MGDTGIDAALSLSAETATTAQDRSVEIVGVVQKNSREKVVVTLETFNGHRVLNARVYFRAEDGEMRPSRKGLTISVSRLPDLLSVLSEAMKVVSPTWRPVA